MARPMRQDCEDLIIWMKPCALLWSVRHRFCDIFGNIVGMPVCELLGKAPLPRLKMTSLTTKKLSRIYFIKDEGEGGTGYLYQTIHTAWWAWSVLHEAVWLSSRRVTTSMDGQQQSAPCNWPSVITCILRFESPCIHPVIGLDVSTPWIVCWKSCFTRLWFSNVPFWFVYIDDPHHFQPSSETFSRC